MSARRLLHLASLVASLGLVVRTASAQDDLESLRGLLDEPVVTAASHVAETATTAPATSSVLTADDMRRYGIRSLDEAINYLSLGVITTDPLNTSEIGARGVLLTKDSGAHVLVLIDGHHLNEPLFGAARVDRGLGVPLEIIDHVEVILGPGSVLYGSNAMLGVINVVTKRANEFGRARVAAESEIGKSYRAAAGASTTLELLGEPAEVTLALEYFKKSGPRVNLGPQNLGIDMFSTKPVRVSRNGPPTGVWGGQIERANYADAPAVYARARRGGIELSVNASMFKRGKPTSPFDFDEPRTDDRDRRLWADLTYQRALGRYVRINTRAYGDSFDFETHNITSTRSACGFPGANVCDYYFGGATRWAGVEASASLDWYEDGRLVTLVGADGRLNYYSYKREIYNDDTRAALQPTRDYTHDYDRTLGVYAQSIWRPAPAFDLNVGARVDARPRFDTALSPRAAANLRPWQSGTVKLIYAEAFRSPTWNELGESYAVQARARDLQPEKVMSLEASLEQRFGAQKALFGVFRTRWHDLIEYRLLSQPEIDRAVTLGDLSLSREAGRVGQYQNVSTIVSYGFNTSFEGTLVDGQLRYGATFTGAFARHRDPLSGAELPLPVAPQAFGNLRVSYELRGGWPTLALAARYVGPSPADRAFRVGFRPEPYGAGNASLRATVSGELPRVPGLFYRASIEVAGRARSPYVIGPTDSAKPDRPSAELAPIDPFRSAVGVEYDF